MSQAAQEKMHDRNSVRREFANTLRKFLPKESAPTPPAAVAAPAAPEKLHDPKSVRLALAKSLRGVVEEHASEMAKLREREDNLRKGAAVVDMKGEHKYLGGRTPNPAPPTKPVGMDEGSGGVIVPGKKLKKSEPPTAKPPSGSIPGKTTPQSSPGGAPAAGAPKSSAAPMAKGTCEHGEGCKLEKCRAMNKALGDFDPKSGGAPASAHAAPGQPATGVRGTPQFKIKMPGRDGTAGLASPKLPAAAPAAPAGGVRIPKPAGAPTMPGPQ